MIKPRSRCNVPSSSLTTSHTRQAHISGFIDDSVIIHDIYMQSVVQYI